MILGLFKKTQKPPFWLQGVFWAGFWGWFFWPSLKNKSTWRINAKIGSKNEFSTEQCHICDKTSKNSCTTWRHIKIWTKNYLITVQQVIKGPRTKAPHKNMQRINPRITLILILLAWNSFSREGYHSSSCFWTDCILFASLPPKKWLGGQKCA